jgi:GNAT superfamily N-acetyltransferase
MIQPLADRPEAIPILAQWFFLEWHSFDGRTVREIEDQLSQNLNRASIPITFVAVRNSELIGTVSLDLSDLPVCDHLSPWLASLYVVPECRRAGVGSALVEHLIDFAFSQRLPNLYVWTPGSTRLYEKLGWRLLQTSTYAGQAITVLRLEMFGATRVRA